MTTLNIGGMGFIQKYDKIQDAIAVSKPNDTIIIHKSITIDQTIEINHDINIEADDNIQVTIADGVVGIELVKGKLNIKDLVVFDRNQSIFIYKPGSDIASITLTNSQLINISSQTAKNCFPEILIKNDDNSINTDLTVNNSAIDFIDVMTKRLLINSSQVGNILKATSQITAYLVEGESFNLSNAEIIANYCNFLNLHSSGQLVINSNLSLNNFTIDPLPFSSEPRRRDNQLISYQQSMNRFDHQRDVIALQVIGNESMNLTVNIQNANLNTEILSTQAPVLNIVAWFKLANCDANISKSIMSHTERPNVSEHSSLSIIDVTDDADHVDNDWLIQDPQY